MDFKTGAPIFRCMHFRVNKGDSNNNNKDDDDDDDNNNVAC
jgi:hypothetical protein